MLVLVDVLPIVLKCKTEANQLKLKKNVKIIFLGFNVNLEPKDYTTKCDNL